MMTLVVGKTILLSDSDQKRQVLPALFNHAKMILKVLNLFTINQ